MITVCGKIALVSIIILLIIIIASILAPLSPYDPNKINVAEKLQGISAKHIFGTDEYGRDYFTRALYGGRISLTVGFCSMIMTVILGTAIGITSGYFGGTYCTEYYGTGHRSGKPWNCQCDSDGVVLKFPWTWSTDSKSFLGKYAAECAGTYSGCTETCGISGSSDSVYSTEFQFTW